jgi:hypothetical protein
MIARSNVKCVFNGYDKPSAGNFTLSADVPAGATSISGTFDLTFAIGGKLTGTFTAPVCPNATEMPLTPSSCL